jgi:cytidyltransferase-like protein
MNTVIVSGYFNPVHSGHVRLIEAARRLGDRLVVILNNDVQQQLKKNRIIMTQAERMEVVGALRAVDEVILAVDQDQTIVRTLEQVARRWPDQHLIFANGGDRAHPEVVPETSVCEKYGIEMRFGVGGEEKANSSSAINRRLGRE